MDRALARAVTDKKPVPEIDFSLHTMEDGNQVSTMERVVKGNGGSVEIAIATS
jgi:serine/threonine-protein phosphatase 2B catalytic subunit